jgi:O-antigen/teichoic acid export membrane protein
MATFIDAPLPRSEQSPQMRAGKSGLARNTLLNFAGQLLPLAAGVLLIPGIVKGLGPARFGVLGIVWVVFGYFSLFDFGLGRATTKFLAEWLEKGQLEEINEMVWISVAIQIVLGLVGCTILISFAPMLAGRILRVPSELVGEVRTTFYLLAATLPIVLATSGLRAVLEGCQRFDISNLLGIPTAAMAFVIPALALPLGLRLPGIIWLLALARLFLLAAYIYACIRVLPCLKSRPVFHKAVILPLLSFGGWVTVDNLINPILVSADRFFIGSLLSIAMVGYYTAPMEAITKLWIIPASLTTTIYPACSALGFERWDELQALYARSFRYLFLILAPISMALFLFAHQIMQLWLGSGFAEHSVIVLQILSVGVFINCFAHVPYCFLQSLGRPDAPAKLFVLELGPYAIFAWFMIKRYGIAGAAIAWSIRAGIEVALLLLIAWSIFSFSPHSENNKRIIGNLAALCLLGMAMVGTKLLFHSFLILEICLVFLWLAGFASAIWWYVLDDSDRSSISALAGPLRLAARGRGAA